jgi:hypothetical protein
VPPSDHGLLARLDALVELVADRHGLALVPGGPSGGVAGGLPGSRLAAAEARVAARAIGLARPRGPGARSPAATQRDAVELLRAVAEGVGLLRVRGDRLEATSLRHAWAQIDRGHRTGQVYAAWCPASHVNWLADVRPEDFLQASGQVADGARGRCSLWRFLWCRALVMLLDQCGER